VVIPIIKMLLKERCGGILFLMIITYHGLESFKVQFGDMVLGFNPPSKESKIKSPKFGADIALISIQDKDFNGADNLSFGEKKPFIISGPGEYDVKGVAIKGFPSVSRYGGKERINAIYMVILEDIRLCFLGALSDKKLSPKVFEEMEDVGVLFVPIGGDGVLSAAEAYEFSVSLEPSIIIPMHFDPQNKALNTFLKEGGEEKITPQEKVTLKKKDVEGKEGEIIVLSPLA
jgi:hypothetical protein